LTGGHDDCGQIEVNREDCILRYVESVGPS